MVTIALMLGAAQLRLAALDTNELRWRRFVHAAVATDTPFSTRLDELRRSVGRLPAPGKRPQPRPALSGPSGL